MNLVWKVQDEVGFPITDLQGKEKWEGRCESQGQAEDSRASAPSLEFCMNGLGEGPCGSGQK